MRKYNIVVIGSSGYTASELIKITINHPNINIKALVGNSKAGKELKEVYHHFKFAPLPILKTLKEVNFSKIDVVFSCLPHFETVKIIDELPKTIKIFDLSSDFRIKNNDLYKKYYKQNLNTKYNKEITYGLSEIYTKKIIEKRIIACPGCYPTSILLPLIPIQDLINKKEIIIDSKTGISGAGRKAIESNLFCEINENIIPYNITSHRHLAEIIEQLNITSENIQFTPQIISASRGILSNIYIKSKYSVVDLRKRLSIFYKNNHFVKINSGNDIPRLRNVTGTNFCEISVLDTNIKNQKIIISAIDNLTKGSSGQAVQNFNIAFNLPENTGLNNVASYP